MDGLGEIIAKNQPPKHHYRVQRDRLGQVLRKVLAQNEGTRIFPHRNGAGHDTVAPGVDTAVEAEARKVLGEIFGVPRG